jgi:hypothetical protein
MRKRTRDDEHLPLLQAGDVHLDQQLAGASNTAGTSNVTGASNDNYEQHRECEQRRGHEQHSGRDIAGVSNIAGTSDIAGVSGAVGASNSAGTNTFPLAVAPLGANIMPGTSGSAGANFTLGTSGSVGAIQANFATYPGTPWDNLRMLEIRSNLGAYASDPLVSEMGLCGSNTVDVWRRRYKEQEDRIQSLTRDINALLKETVDKSVIIADQKAKLECLRTLVKEPTSTNDAPQEVVTTAETEDTEMEVDVVALDHVVENVTYGLVETETMPLGGRRTILMPPS